jgi:UDP:flavonoid glycosyltransferase YjiC (YdhE family)
MATVLFTWELGGGLGHLLPMRSLARGLVVAGHRVYLALREIAPASVVFGNMGASLLQAPFRHSRPGRLENTPGFSQILDNIGFGEDGELFGLVCAWRNLIGFVRPNLIVFDHSPTALLAARCFPDVRRVISAPGFFCPPDVSPWPALVRRPIEKSELEVHEAGLLARVNRLLLRSRRPPLDRLGRLYSDVDEQFLLTFPELDHYPDRPVGARYMGPVITEGGKRPDWPKGGAGNRIYAYLKASKSLEGVLKVLAGRGDSTLVFVDGIDPATRKKFSSPTLRFETERLDLAAVGEQCNVAVHNANHGTLARLLLAGRPMVQLPLTLEQTVLARAVDRTGAAETVLPGAPDVGEAFACKLDKVLGSERYAAAAGTFARCHDDFDPVVQVQQMVGRMEQLLHGGESWSRRLCGTAAANAAGGAVFAG